LSTGATAGNFDDDLGAEGARSLGVAFAAHRGHRRATNFGDLHGEMPDTARGAVDEHGLAAQIAALAKPIECGEPGDRQCRRKLERHAVRHAPQPFWQRN
jgi:hypothetical protein